MKTPYLVQRLKHQLPHSDKRGFDRYFSLEYMGSSEFEWGAPGNSLRRIRSAGELEILEHPMTIDGLTRAVHLVGPVELLAATAAGLDIWASGDTPFKALEYTNFPEAFTGQTSQWFSSTIAWWDLGLDVAWTLEADVAQKLMVAFAPTGV